MVNLRNGDLNQFVILSKQLAKLKRRKSSNIIKSNNYVHL